MNQNAMNDTKRAIQNAFITLYCKVPFNKMSVKELCSQTPVARTTFYSYYDNLGDLKAEIENTLVGGILEIAKSIKQERFSERDLNVFFSLTLDYVKSHWNENYAFLVARPNFDYISKWKDAVKYHFGLRFPEEASVPNYDLIMEVIASAVIGAYTYWMQNPDKVNAQKLAEVSVRMLFTAEQIGLKEPQ